MSRCIADYYPFQDPFGGPNYFALDERRPYVINIDNDGDGYADLQFVFDFTNKLGGDDESRLSSCPSARRSRGAAQEHRPRGHG